MDAILILELLLRQNNCIHFRHTLKETCNDAYKMVNNIKYKNKNKNPFVEIMKCVKDECIKCIKDYEQCNDNIVHVILAAYNIGYTNVKHFNQKHLYDDLTTKTCIKRAIKNGYRDENIKYSLINNLINNDAIKYKHLQFLSNHADKYCIINYLSRLGKQSGNIESNNISPLLNAMIKYKLFDEIIANYKNMDNEHKYGLMENMNMINMDINLKDKLQIEILKDIFNNELKLKVAKNESTYIYVSLKHENFINDVLNENVIRIYLNSGINSKVDVLINPMIKFKMFDEILDNYRYVSYNNIKRLFRSINLRDLSELIILKWCRAIMKETYRYYEEENLIDKYYKKIEI